MTCRYCTRTRCRERTLAERVAVLEAHIAELEGVLREKPDQPILNAARRLVQATDNAERNAALGDLAMYTEPVP